MATREELQIAAKRILATSEFQLLMSEVQAGLIETLLATDASNVEALQGAALRYEAFREMLEYIRQTAT